MLSPEIRRLKSFFIQVQVAWGKWHSLLRSSCLQENCVSWRKKAPLLGSPWKPWCWAGLVAAFGEKAVCLYFHDFFFQSKVGFSFLFLLFPPRPYLSGIVTTWAIGANLHQHLWSLPPRLRRRKSCCHEGSAPLWRCRKHGPTFPS